MGNDERRPASLVVGNQEAVAKPGHAGVLRDILAVKISDLHRMTVKRYYFAEENDMEIARVWQKEAEKELMEIFFLFMKYVVSVEPGTKGLSELLVRTIKLSPSEENKL